MSKASTTRARRRQLIADIRMKCADCGREVKPVEIQEPMPDVFVYSARCSCGSFLQGMMGPPDLCLHFQGFMTGYAMAHGGEVPRSEIQTLPRGWHDHLH